MRVRAVLCIHSAPMPEKGERINFQILELEYGLIAFAASRDGNYLLPRDEIPGDVIATVDNAEINLDAPLFVVAGINFSDAREMWTGAARALGATGKTLAAAFKPTDDLIRRLRMERIAAPSPKPNFGQMVYWQDGKGFVNKDGNHIRINPGQPVNLSPGCDTLNGDQPPPVANVTESIERADAIRHFQEQAAADDFGAMREYGRDMARERTDRVLDAIANPLQENMKTGRAFTIEEIEAEQERLAQWFNERQEELESWKPQTPLAVPVTAAEACAAFDAMKGETHPPEDDPASVSFQTINRIALKAQDSPELLTVWEHRVLSLNGYRPDGKPVDASPIIDERTAPGA